MIPHIDWVRVFVILTVAFSFAMVFRRLLEWRRPLVRCPRCYTPSNFLTGGSLEGKHRSVC